ncbi:glycosyltransferase [Ideonella dechloratans]|uniref:Glycosyltransferase n=1 Tax=Ideonella dechloratans TaxID=36863 RepID=A0A643F9T6_IDEDE|nr:glycosyltransferase family 4 protein [Ideonella dechloratans]KAB0577388.1 glycosyltransferase [Ideonella dechloratans]UFU09251.1 glycosyltransferase family 4 protein [Ideonella dechloratans]
MTFGLPADHTLLFFAPFKNRSGYGMGGRALAAAWHAAGLRVRLVSVNAEEPGIDDFDLDLLTQLESTPLSGQVIALFYHVPSQSWLDIKLPPGSLRVMLTTFDGALQGALPPAEWVRVCNHMDLVCVAANEMSAWRDAGLQADKLRPLVVPHIWFNNPKLPPVQPMHDDGALRFVTVAMFQPRRRWDTLFEAFLQEFADEPKAELHVKVNYPSWHPVPGQPQRDLQAILARACEAHPSQARIFIDDALGTRLDICRLIDRSHYYVSTDTAVTAPVGEALIRGKRIIVAHSVGSTLLGMDAALITIDEDPRHSQPITPEILAYQPHHKEASMPLLHVADVRAALRRARQERAQSLQPWAGWADWLAVVSSTAHVPSFFEAIAQAAAAKAADRRIPVRWEGSQFVYHSLALVNRQLCLGLLASGEVNLGIRPFEPDQFDPAKSMPTAQPLVACVGKPLESTAVHVRHQWPPNFTPPPEGMWVMIQPWEFGGIPQDWVAPMRDQVDEIWVPSQWVRDCYVASGVPADKLQVIPNGVDLARFSPGDSRYPLKTRKKFKILFVGGTIHRKGIDVVLEAYLHTFKSHEDVCLLIKGQPGTVYQGSDLHGFLENVRTRFPDAPEIEYITDALTEDEVIALYRSCNVLALPYRGEGFGLPIAEAMACGLPVIVTREGAAADFVREEFAFLIPSERSPTQVDRFKPSAPGFWLQEPDLKAVSRAMRAAYTDRAALRDMGRRARAFAEAHLSWQVASDLVLSRLRVLSTQTPRRFKPRKQAFLCDVDWTTLEWVEILIAYASEFAPGDPVTLAFALTPSNTGGMNAQQIIGLIAEALSMTGKSEYADIMLIESVEDTMDLFKTHDVQWVDNTSGSALGLDGELGQRLGKARLLYQAAVRGS